MVATKLRVIAWTQSRLLPRAAIHAGNSPCPLLGLALLALLQLGKFPLEFR
jgi:hypothetical protein